MERFDGAAFYSALDAVRSARGLTWKEVGVQAGVNASTLSRIGKGKKPDVNGLAALLAWSHLKAEMFISDSEDRLPDPIAQIASIIRMDRSLSSKNADIMEDIVRNTYDRLKKG